MSDADVETKVAPVAKKRVIKKKKLHKLFYTALVDLTAFAAKNCQDDFDKDTLRQARARIRLVDAATAYEVCQEWVGENSAKILGMDDDHFLTQEPITDDMDEEDTDLTVQLMSIIRAMWPTMSKKKHAKVWEFLGTMRRCTIAYPNAV